MDRQRQTRILACVTTMIGALFLATSEPATSCVTPDCQGSEFYCVPSCAPGVWDYDVEKAYCNSMRLGCCVNYIDCFVPPPAYGCFTFPATICTFAQECY